MDRILKVGVIGVGGIARSHMPGWAASPHAEVVAGCDLDEDVLNNWGQLHGVSNLSTRPEELFDDPDIDIIDVCTPSNYHAPIAIAALDGGKHVLCEKPLAPNPGAVRDMIAARDAADKMLMTAQHFRFRGISKALKTEIDTGALGDVYHARAWMLRRASAPMKPGSLTKKHSGGGACIDIGVHILDLTLWMMGNPNPVTVSGVTRDTLARIPGAFSAKEEAPYDTKIWDVEEMAAAFVRFENGATLMLEVSWMLHHGIPGEDLQMWLYGTGGGSHWPSCEIYQSNYTTRQLYNRKLTLTKDKLKAHAQECVEFARAIVDGSPSPVPAEQSLQVMTILDAIYQSQESGREVVL